MRYADGDDPAGAGHEPDAPSVQVQDRFPAEHVEALLVGVDVALDMAVRELLEREPHVHGPVVRTDQGRAAETDALVRIGGCGLDLLPADERVHGATSAASRRRPEG